MTTAQDTADAAKLAAAEELGSAMDKVIHCLNQLSAQQVWWRPEESMNSIANLLLHLCGNVRQWIIAGVGGVEDTRNRPQEFAQRDTIPKQELLKRLEETVTEAQATIAGATPDELITIRRIQGYDVSGISAIFQSVAHFRGHTQEIVHLTRAQLGDDYQFDFVPTTPEQGAPTK